MHTNFRGVVTMIRAPTVGGTGAGRRWVGLCARSGAHLEPTCLALVALAAEPEPFQTVIAGGKSALRQAAAGDGTYRLERGRPEAVWPTALVLFAQAALDEPTADIQRTAGALIGLRGRLTESDKEQEVHDIDLQLVGWSWAEGTFSWVEPTAWACLASAARWPRRPRRSRRARLLLDRALDEGGVNYGNRRILGRILEPIPGPTALMLLALQLEPRSPRIRAAVTYLCQQAQSGEDLEHLCWAKLALDVYRDCEGVPESLPRLDERIRAACTARTETNYVRPHPLRVALTALALDTDIRNPFRLHEAKKPAEILTVPRRECAARWASASRRCFRAWPSTRSGS